MLDKTKTITKRVISIYLPTEEVKQEWTRIAAKEAGISEEEQGKRYFLSRFIQRVVNDHIAKVDDPDHVPPSELRRKIQVLEKENADLREDLRQKTMLVKNLDTEVRIYRSKPFLEEGFTGVRRFEGELVKLFKERKFMRPNEVLVALKVEPKDADLVDAITKQIETIEEYGIIKPTPKGWRWAL